ncbi:MAG: ABC transporter ATP-binding protein [Eubacteriales bacterium]
MIQIEDLSFQYQGAKTPSLCDVTLHIQQGEFILLTGESGCGKTTLTRILNGLCPQFYAGTIKGNCLLEKETILSLNLSEIGLRVGSVFQDPRSQFYTRNTTDEIVTSMEYRNFSQDDMEGNLTYICDLLKIHPLLDQDIFKLSSGEKQKIAIASACVTKPKILVLDEPSANLDGVGTKQLTDLLQKLKEQGVTIVVSEHRLQYLQGLFDRMIVMDQGKIKCSYTRAQAEQLSDETLVEMGLRLLNTPDNMKSSAKHQEEICFDIKELSFLRKKTEILTELSVKIPKGKITVVTGENGSGKTTLCKILCGLLKENNGKILWGHEVFPKKQRIKQCFFVGQDADYQLFCPTVWEEVGLNLKKTEDLQTANTEILDKLHLLEYKDRHPVSLSGGQKQRVLLATSLLRERKILILDEPTSGLDGNHMRIIAKILQDFAQKHQITILVITHDIEFGNLIADSVLTLKKGD